MTANRDHSVNALRQHFQSKISLTPTETEELLAAFREKILKKKQILLKPGQVAEVRNYVASGGLRAYVLDKDGNDQTIQFAVEDWWISDYNSYVTRQPATMFVEAFEDSIVLQLDYETEMKLKKSNHAFETIFRMMAERSAAFQQRRIILAITQSAQERYAEFQKRYPSLSHRLPQYALATYLGMTKEFLSKIRNNRVK
jgi:CRP-like cAMP-binding protein